MTPLGSLLASSVSFITISADVCCSNQVISTVTVATKVYTYQISGFANTSGQGCNTIVLINVDRRVDGLQSSHYIVWNAGRLV